MPVNNGIVHTFSKSADEALISLHVLLSSNTHAQNNSSNGFSLVKNMGWYRWPSSEAAHNYTLELIWDQE